MKKAIGGVLALTMVLMGGVIGAVVITVFQMALLWIGGWPNSPRIMAFLLSWFPEPVFSALPYIGASLGLVGGVFWARGMLRH